MIEVFQPPRITREETAYKMLFHVFAAFAALAVSMAGLFYSMAGDSRKNRDALHKVTSPETELWAIIVFAVFVLAAVYLSVAGVVLSRRVRGQFVRWVKKGGKLYFVSASASNVRASGSSRRISSSLKLQDASLNVLNDSGANLSGAENSNVYSALKGFEWSGDEFGNLGGNTELSVSSHV